MTEQNYSLKQVKPGRRLAWSVACDPCAEALQRTWVGLPARVPLLRVTPPLLPCFLSRSSDKKLFRQKKYFQKKNQTSKTQKKSLKVDFLWVWTVCWTKMTDSSIMTTILSCTESCTDSRWISCVVLSRCSIQKELQ